MVKTQSSFQSYLFRIMTVKSTIRVGSHKLQSIIRKNIDALGIIYIWILLQSN